MKVSTIKGKFNHGCRPKYRCMFQIKDHNQRGEFIVRVSKYNNKFEIFLRVGVKEYPLKKTNIYAFLTTPRRGEEEDEPYYSNNWNINPDDIRFIGG